jgi:nondiscriminating glutamyl-tRNA synthetase
MNEHNKKPIVTRFAPSPTGNLHVGGFRTALFNYLYAKHHGGKVVLRIEDTDRERSKPEYEKNIHDGLAWLGLTFDETYRQSERGTTYSKYVTKLIEEGSAYVSKEDTSVPTDAEKSAGPRRSEVIRFKNPNTTITFFDIIRGEISFDTTELGDFVIAKSIEEPLYNFAVVVDDFEMGITHVIRGEDHISNTPRQILIGKAIGATTPIYAHLPLILASDKSKLSKRKGARALTEYRDMGYYPEALTNFMAMLGWSPGTDQEIFSIHELVEKFDVAQVQKSGAVYNEEKLRWVNREYLKRKTHVEIARDAKKFIVESPAYVGKKWELTDELMMKLVPTIIDRISVFADLSDMVAAGELDYFFSTPSYDPKDLIWRDETDSQRTKEFFKEVIGMLEKAPDDTFSDIDRAKALLWDYASLHGRGAVLWPIRFALTGKNKSPDPFTLLTILGKKESIARLKHAEKSLH